MMNTKEILLVEDLKTNLSSFPETIKKGTVGKELFTIDKEEDIVMVDFFINGQSYLLTISRKLIEDVNS
jgi:hypothetical protein